MQPAIRYADSTTRDAVRDMWKTCFGDSDAYMDIYFREKYRDERTLIYLEENRPIASLQMLPYQFTFHGVEIPILYLSGVCTLPEARKKGYMDVLLRYSLTEMARKGFALTLLVPGEPWLLDFYRRYGFAQTFDAGTEPLSSLSLLKETYPNPNDAYRTFDRWFRASDMTVQKNQDDFRAIMEEAELFSFPSKKSLTGMARILDAEKLLSVFASKYPQKQLSFTISDEILPANNRSFSIQNGKVDSADTNCPVRLSIDTLAQLVLGYHTSETEEPFRSIFPEKTPQIHFMLE